MTQNLVSNAPSPDRSDRPWLGECLSALDEVDAHPAGAQHLQRQVPYELWAEYFAYPSNPMINISFDDLAERLSPEALDLFRKMAAAHFESTGDRLFIRADSFAGPGMIFSGRGSNQDFDGLDVGALEDLISWDLLHTDASPKGTPNYRVTGEAVRFYKWLEQSQSSATDRIADEPKPGLPTGHISAHDLGLARLTRVEPKQFQELTPLLEPFVDRRPGWGWNGRLG